MDHTFQEINKGETLFLLALEKNKITHLSLLKKLKVCYNITGDKYWKDYKKF